MRNFSKKVLFWLITVILIYLWTTALTGCKVRQVDLEKKSVEVNTDSTNVKKSTISKADSTSAFNKVQQHNVDTSKTNTKLTEQERDSTVEETTIYSGGQVINIGPDQSFTGHADSARLKKSSVIHKNKDQSFSIQNHQFKDSTGTATLTDVSHMQKNNSDSTHKKQSLKKTSKIKKTLSKPDYSWIWYVAAIIAVLLLILMVYEKFNPVTWLRGLFKKKTDIPA